MGQPSKSCCKAYAVYQSRSRILSLLQPAAAFLMQLLNMQATSLEQKHSKSLPGDILQPHGSTHEFKRDSRLNGSLAHLEEGVLDRWAVDALVWRPIEFEHQHLLDIIECSVIIFAALQLSGVPAEQSVGWG